MTSWQSITACEALAQLLHVIKLPLLSTKQPLRCGSHCIRDITPSRSYLICPRNSPLYIGLVTVFILQIRETEAQRFSNLPKIMKLERIY